jgi:uncharacterized protein YkwD
MVLTHSRMRRAVISAAVAALLVATGAVTAAADTSPPDVPPVETVAAGDDTPYAANVELVKAQILVATNNARIRAGLPPVAPSPKLGAAAQSWADTYDDHGYTHSPDLLADVGGWDYGWSGAIYENLHLAPDGIRGVRGWLDSAAHRQHLLDPAIDRIGIGVAVAEDGRYFLVQQFSTGGSGRARDTDASMYTRRRPAGERRGDHRATRRCTRVPRARDGSIGAGLSRHSAIRDSLDLGDHEDRGRRIVQDLHRPLRDGGRLRGTGARREHRSGQPDHPLARHRDESQEQSGQE